MSRTFFVRQVVLASGVHAADNEQEIDLAVGDGTTLSGSANATDETHMGTTVAALPNETPWPTGDYVRTIDVSSADLNAEFGLLTLGGVAGHHGRVDAALTSDLETHEQVESAHVFAGLKTCSTGSVSWTAGATTDRYESVMVTNRTSGHGSTSVTQRYGANNSVTGPWTAIVDVTGTLGGSTPTPTMGATGDAKTGGAFAGTTPVATMASSGLAKTAGALAASTPPPAMASSGAAKTSGALTGSTPAPTMASSGETKTVGALAGATPVPTSTAAGEAKRVGALLGQTPAPLLASAGAVTNIIGVVAGSSPVPTLTSEGEAKRTGALAGATTTPAASFSGEAKRSGSLVGSTPVPTLASSGGTKVAGILAGTSTAPSMVSAGQSKSTTSGALVGETLPPAMLALGFTGIPGSINGVLSGTTPSLLATMHGYLPKPAPQDAHTLTVTTAARRLPADTSPRRLAA